MKARIPVHSRTTNSVGPAGHRGRLAVFLPGRIRFISIAVGYALVLK
jgi:hypothetical protein